MPVDRWGRYKAPMLGLSMIMSDNQWHWSSAYILPTVNAWYHVVVIWDMYSTWMYVNNQVVITGFGDWQGYREVGYGNTAVRLMSNGDPTAYSFWGGSLGIVRVSFTSASYAASQRIQILILLPSCPLHTNDVDLQLGTRHLRDQPQLDRRLW